MLTLLKTRCHSSNKRRTTPTAVFSQQQTTLKTTHQNISAIRKLHTLRSGHTLIVTRAAETLVVKLTL